MIRARNIIYWSILIIAVVVPFAAAATSPLLAWRDPIYIVAGFAGITAMALLVFQPLLAAASLPGLTAQRARLAHLWVGTALLLSVIIHVAGLWITSPPDVIDALLFTSPTPFSVWGVMAMWGVMLTACLAGFRRRLRVRAQTWRLLHSILAIVIVLATVVHALMIEGTMETLSKVMLCALVVVTCVVALIKRRMPFTL